jgi:hypothetical protein
LTLKPKRERKLSAIRKGTSLENFSRSTSLTNTAAAVLGAKDSLSSSHMEKVKRRKSKAEKSSTKSSNNNTNNNIISINLPAITGQMFIGNSSSTNVHAETEKWREDESEDELTMISSSNQSAKKKMGKYYVSKIYFRAIILVLC